MRVVMCDEAAAWVEALADGQPSVPPEVRAHVDGCSICAGDLELARRLQRLLAERRSPPAGFTSAVLRRARSEWWRGEQTLDRWFNALVAGGMVTLVTALALMAVWTGALPLAVELAAASVQTLLASLQGAIPGVPLEVTATFVFIGAVALWRWLAAAEA